MKDNIEDAIKKYIEDRYGYEIGKMLDRLENEGLYDDPNDVSGEKFSRAVSELTKEVVSEEGIMKDSCYDKVVEGTIAVVAWEWAGLNIYDGKIVWEGCTTR